MIRTRDLVLFVVTILFLLTGISGTVLREQTMVPSTPAVVLTPGQVPASATAPSEATIDYRANQERLAALLEQTVSAVTPTPSVTTDADTAATPSVGTSSDVQRTPQYCLYPDDTLPYVGRWPLAGADVAVVEGARIAYTDSTVTLSDTGTSSAVTEEVRSVFLTLPINPANTGAANCVPSEVVGITPAGILIFNEDVRSYRGLNEHQLVGYARDGFPIYGPYSGETDACGGYQHPAGYRYTVGTERDYIIGCYQAPPQSFSF